MVALRFGVEASRELRPRPIESRVTSAWALSGLRSGARSGSALGEHVTFVREVPRATGQPTRDSDHIIEKAG